MTTDNSPGAIGGVRSLLRIEGLALFGTALLLYAHSGASWNEALWHYKNPAVDKALEAARLSGDAAVQKTNYIAMQFALVADPASFFAYAVNFACAYGKSVGGITTHPMRWFDLRTATVA